MPTAIIVSMAALRLFLLEAVQTTERQDLKKVVKEILSSLHSSVEK
jgi:hypothetical protein